MYEEISTTQIERIGNVDYTNKKDISKLLKSDKKLVYNLAFKMSGKSSLTTKQLNHWLEVAIVELACEKLRRDGILKRTSKGWSETKLGKEKRLKEVKQDIRNSSQD
jgi:hypothetical protein